MERLNVLIEIRYSESKIPLLVIGELRRMFGFEWEREQGGRFFTDRTDVSVTVKGTLAAAMIQRAREHTYVMDVRMLEKTREAA